MHYAFILMCVEKEQLPENYASVIEGQACRVT